MPNTPLPSPRRSVASSPAPSGNERERVAEFLSERFAADALSLDEFEERVAAVYRVATRAELEALSSDLRADMPVGEVAPATAKPAALDTVPARGRRFAILSNLEHHSIAVVPRHLDVSAVLGNVELDLRDAKFGTGTTEIHVSSVLGHIGITLPSGTLVEQHASGILGSFECPPSPRAYRSSDPRVTISGSAVLGAVEIRFADRASAALQRANRLDRPRR